MPYDASLLATVTLQQVRWLLGGAKTDSMVPDAEINFALSQESNIYLAAAAIADQIGSQFAATSQRVTIGPLSTSDWQLKSAWDALSRHLRKLGMKHTGFSAAAIMPGMTIAEIESPDTDYPAMWLRSRVHDNTGNSMAPDDMNWSG